MTRHRIGAVLLATVVLVTAMCVLAGAAAWGPQTNAQTSAYRRAGDTTTAPPKVCVRSTGWYYC